MNLCTYFSKFITIMNCQVYMTAMGKLAYDILLMKLLNFFFFKKV